MNNHNKGITLVEVMMSVALIGIGFLAISAVFVSTPEIARRGKEVSTAVNIVRNAMEVYKSTSFANLPAVGTYTYTTTQLNNLRTGAATVIVTNETDANLKRIAIRVTWHNGTMSMRSDFLRTNRGVFN